VALADCMLVAGTSTTVYPAAGFPQQVLAQGGCLIEVNPEASEFSGLAAHPLCGPAGAVLTRLVHHIALAEATG
jgi:NAD-dependent deacetylase